MWEGKEGEKGLRKREREIEKERERGEREMFGAKRTQAKCFTTGVTETHRALSTSYKEECQVVYN